MLTGVERMSEIYGDVYFFINFSMDMICLYLVGTILRLKIKISGLIFGSLLGAVYSLVALFLKAGGFISFLITIIAAFTICFVAFYDKKSRRTYPVATVLFFAVSFFLGGTLTYVYSFLGKLFSGASSSASIILLPCSLLCGLISFALSRIHEKRSVGRVVEITVCTQDAERTFSAYADTGNLLTEPAGALPVVVLCRDASKNYIPSGVFSADEIMKHSDLARTIRIIPTKSVSGAGVLVGFVPKGVRIKGSLKRCCVAFSDVEAFNGTQALLPSNII